MLVPKNTALDQNMLNIVQFRALNLAEPLILLHSFKVGLEKHGFRPNAAAKKSDIPLNKIK